MWKLISLSALLIVAQAAVIQDFYGDWIEVAFFPATTYIPICIRFTYEKATEDMRCVYSDGRNATTVKVSMTTEIGELARNFTVPMMVVDTAAEVMPALNISCKCNDKEARDRAVVRLVNDDYFILYSNVSPSKLSSRSDTVPNDALLFAREVVSGEELNLVMTKIEDLKNRRVAVMCEKANYGGFKTSGNNVL